MPGPGTGVAVRRAGVRAAIVYAGPAGLLGMTVYWPGPGSTCNQMHACGHEGVSRSRIQISMATCFAANHQTQEVLGEERSAAARSLLAGCGAAPITQAGAIPVADGLRASWRPRPRTERQSVHSLTDGGARALRCGGSFDEHGPSLCSTPAPR